MDGWEIGQGFTVVGAPPVGEAEEPAAHYQMVNAKYFETLGIRLVHGRAFTEHDDATATPVCIVNEELVRRYLKGMQPGMQQIGAHIRVQAMDMGGPKPMVREVVGVVHQVKISGPAEKNELEIYVPITQNPWFAASIAVRTAGDPLAMAPAVKAAIARVDKRTGGDARAHHGGSGCPIHGPAPLPRAACGNIRRAGAGGRRYFRRAGVFGKPAHAGIRHSHGAGRAFRRCAPDGGGQRPADCAHRHRHWIGRCGSSHPLAGGAAVWREARRSGAVPGRAAGARGGGFSGWRGACLAREPCRPGSGAAPGLGNGSSSPERPYCSSVVTWTLPLVAPTGRRWSARNSKTTSKTVVVPLKAPKQEKPAAGAGRAEE